MAQKADDTTKKIYDFIVSLGLVDSNLPIERMSIDLDTFKSPEITVKYRGKEGTYETKT